MQSLTGSSSAAGVPAISPSPRRGVYPAYVKRGMDLAIVLSFGFPAMILMACAALVIWVSGGVPFYRHERVGRNGHIFQCWKLRTMLPDADSILAAHLRSDPEAAEEWRRTRKLRRDPRITPLGKWLRKASIDELPQLLNVLRGEMSLVGPRPVTATELATYGSAARAYLRLTPGITGLWQVSGRNGLTLSERIAFDTEYARRISLGADLGILLRTVPVLLDGS